MAKQTIAMQAAELGNATAVSLGLSIWHTEFVKEGASYYLRYYIDKPDGVTIEDCEAFSRAIDPLLDEADFIEESYCLEVSSPGIERQLSEDRHFAECIGSEVRVRLIRPIDGQKEFVGVLAGHTLEQTDIRVGEDTLSFPQAQIAWVKLYYNDEF